MGNRNQRAIDLYDDEVGQYTTPQTREVIKKGWVEKRVQAYRAGQWAFDVDPVQLAQQEFESDVEPERARRSQRLGEEVDYLLDGFKEDGTYVDPVLGQAHRVGDGTDLVLRYWGRDEWLGWSYKRLKNAAEVSAAAKQDADRAEAMIRQLDAEGVRYTGDLAFS